MLARPAWRFRCAPGYPFSVRPASLTGVGVGDAQAQISLPHLERRGEATRLIVNGKPYLVLGGETDGPSSKQRRLYGADLAEKLAAMHPNTVLVPVAWETIEPEEGKFDFSNVDGLIKGAHDNNLRWYAVAAAGRTPIEMAGWSRARSDTIPPRRDGATAAAPAALPFLHRRRARCRSAPTPGWRRHRARSTATGRVLFVQVENEVADPAVARSFGPGRGRPGAAVPDAMWLHRRAPHPLNPRTGTAWRRSGRPDYRARGRVFGAGSTTDPLFMSRWVCDLYRARHRRRKGRIRPAPCTRTRR